MKAGTELTTEDTEDTEKATLRFRSWKETQAWPAH